MNIQLEVAMVGALQAIVVAILGGIFARDSKKRKVADELMQKNAKRAEERAELRAEESMLAIKLMYANISLSKEMVIALRKRGEINGELNDAIDATKAAETSYKSFLDAVAARKLAEGGN